jgi:hypothetical protein
MTRAGRQSAAALILLASAFAGACGPGDGSRPMRGAADDVLFTVHTEPQPPYARERTTYRVVVRDRDTNAPIQGGQGQVYATSADAVNVSNGLVEVEELGTYSTTLNFVTAGHWAVAVRFRRDSVSPFRTMDWSQQVRPARDPF